jgi:hypothetical protein
MKYDPVLSMVRLLEKQCEELKWGTISGNVVLVNGLPKIETLNIVNQKRIKFPPGVEFTGLEEVIIKM